jgi:hypothetical protein
VVHLLLDRVPRALPGHVPFLLVSAAALPTGSDNADLEVAARRGR